MSKRRKRPPRWIRERDSKMIRRKLGIASKGGRNATSRRKPEGWALYRERLSRRFLQSWGQTVTRRGRNFEQRVLSSSEKREVIEGE